MKNQHVSCILFLLSAVFLGCSQKITGSLINPRDYLNTNGMTSDFSTQTAFRGNLPAAILTPKNKIFYLDLPSQKLEPYIGQQIKIEGKVLKSQALISPEIVWQKSEGEWKKIQFPK